MKIVLSESQYRKILSEEKEQKVFHIPSLMIFNDDWGLLQKILIHRGNPPYSIGGDLQLGGTPIQSLGNLQSVGGNLSLIRTPLSKIYTIEQIRQMVNVDGEIYL